MQLPKFAVQNHHFTLIILFLMFAFGINSFITMPRTEDPQVIFPGASVIVRYPGANPKDIEQLIVDPIEAELNSLEDVKIIESYSTNDFCNIMVEFYFGVDADEKFRDIMEKVNGIRKDLPQDITTIEFVKYEVGAVNIMQLALVSDSASYKILKNQADDLKDLLARVEGVRQVKIYACPEQEVEIQVDIERMSKMNVSMQRIIDVVKASNAIIPGGTIKTQARKFNIHTSGSYQSLQDIENTIIASDGGKLVYLKDVAQVYFGYEDKDYHARFNGQKAVFLALNQKKDTNILDVVVEIKKQVAAFNETLPASLSLHYVFDQSKSVIHRFDTFFFNLLQGMIIVGVLVFLGVGLRASFIVMSAVPLSIFIGIGFLDVSGFYLEQISIAGLVLVLGILVDNAIVVTENVSRHLELGKLSEDAAIKGTAQVGWPIVSATVTTLCAFIPLLMLRDASGEFIRTLPLTVIYTLSASLLIALTFTPYVSSKLLKRVDTEKLNFIQRRLKAFINTRYKQLLSFCLKKPLLVIGIAVLAFALSIGLFTFLGVSFFPKAEKPQFLININTPTGSSVTETDRAVRFIEEILSDREEILHYASNIGGGNPRIYYNVFSERERSNVAQIYVELKRRDFKKQQKLIAELRELSKNYSGANIDVKELQQGVPIFAAVSMVLIAGSIADLELIAKDVEDMFNQTPGIINVNNPLATSRTDLKVHINREKAGLLGLPLIDIDRVIRASVSGLKIAEYRDREGNQYDMLLKLSVSKDGRTRINDLERVHLTSLTGRQIPLMQVAALELKSDPIEIRHYNLERSVDINADVLDGYTVDEVVSKILGRFAGYSWPQGSRYLVSGELESRERSFGGMGVATIIAIIAVFGVLVLQFRSFTQPLIIFSSLPFAFIGSIVALFITQNSFSFTAFVGMASLVGIVVNDAIILVDFTNQLIKQGKKLNDALIEAGQTRFISILLTSATTIGGLLPLTLQGGNLWAPLGWTIIGGLFTSTLLTLIVIPVLFKIIAGVQRRVTARLGNLF